MTDAGRYGPDNFIDPNGKPVKNTPFEVRQNGVLSTLYSDVARSSTVSNPGMSDTLGNIMFYAEPGYYDLTVGETTLSVAVDTIGGGTGLTNLDVHEIPFPSIGTTPGAWQGNPTWSDGGPNIEGDWTGQDSNTFAVPFKGLSPISAVSVWGNGFTCALTGSVLANSDVDPTLTILTLAEWSRPTSDWTLSDCDAFQARWAYMDEDEIWHVVRTDVNIVGQLDSAGALTIPGGWPDSPPEEATSVILDFGVSVWLPDGSFALPVGFSHRSQVTTFGSDDIVSSSTGTILCNGCTELTLDDSIVPYQEGMVIFILTSGDSVDLLAGSGSPLIDKNNDAQSSITLASNSRAILQRVEGAWTLIVDGVGAGGVGAQLDEENTWTALQRFLTSLPHTPFADIGTTEPTTMVIAEDEHGEIASFVATAVDFGGGPGPVYVSCGMRVSERDTNGDPTGNYSYFMFSSPTQSWSLSVADGTTIGDLFAAASGGHLSELAVGAPTNDASAVPRGALNALIVAFTGGTGLLNGQANVEAALKCIEGILDRTTAVNAVSVVDVDVSLYVGQVVPVQPTLSFGTTPKPDGLFALLSQTDPHTGTLYHLDEDGGWVQEHYPNVLIGPQYEIILNDAASPADGRIWKYLPTDTSLWQRGTGISDALGEVNEDLSTEEQTVWWPVPGRWVADPGPEGLLDEAAAQDLIDSAISALSAGDVGAIPSSEAGAANGVATLDGDGKLTADQRPDTVSTAVVPTEVWVGPAELTGAFGSLSSSDGSASRPAAWLIPDATTSLLGTDLRAHVPTEWAAMDVYLRAYQPSAVTPTGKVFEAHLEYGSVGVGDTVPTTGNWLNSDLLLHTPGAQNVMTEHLLSLGIPVVQGAYQQPIRLSFGRNSPTDTFDTGTLGVLGLRLVQNDGSADPTAVTAAAAFRAKVTAGAADVDLAVIGDSTGDATTEWVYRLGQRLAARHRTHSVRYRLWNTTTHAWSAWTTVQTGTGAHTISIHNMSMSGWSEVHWATELPAAAAAVTPDLAFVSLGHNSTTGSSFTTTYGAFVAQVAAAWPAAALILIAQNPGTVTPADQGDRRTRIIAVATGGGWGWVDVFTLFGGLSPITSPQTYYSDTVHPGPIGSSRWAGRVFAALDGT